MYPMEERFHAAAEIATDAILLANEQGAITYINKATEYIFGYVPDDLFTKPLKYLVTERFHLGLDKILSSGDVHLIGHQGRLIEMTGLKKDHTEFPIEISLSSWHVGPERGFTVIIRDITQRKQVEASNIDLEHFAYEISHDLQEPLRTVTSYVHLLERRYGSQLDQDAKEFIQFAVEGVRRMKNLINGLLDYSRVGKAKLALRRTDSKTVLDQVLANLQIALEEKKATVACDFLPMLMVDPVQLAELFQNLIANAIKFCGPQPPQIHIGARAENDHWLFWVQDNGIGIDPQHATRIFEIFQRLHPADQYPGTGLGLAICKKIVERHRGRIWIQSNPGQGSTFYFSLPGGWDPNFPIVNKDQ